MEGEFSLKRFLGHLCPDYNQLHVPLSTRVIRNALWSHFKRFTCHLDDEIICRAHRHNSTMATILGDEDSAPVLACQFSKDGLGGHLLATGDKHGQVVLMDTRKRAQQSVIEEFMAHGSAIHEICWNGSGSKLVTASADKTLKLWDVNYPCKKLSTMRGHQRTIYSVDMYRDEPTIILSGGRDGMVAVWDTRYNNRGVHHSPLHTSQCRSLQAVTRKRFRPKELSKRSVTVVRFLGDHGILSSDIDGVIKQWDKRFLSEACHMFKAPKKLGCTGITALALDSSHTQLFASCMDNKIYAFNCIKSQKTPIAQYGNHIVSSYNVKIALSPDDRYLLSGSSDTRLFLNGGYIWEVNNKEGADHCMEPLMMLPGRGGEFTGVAWCPSELSKVVTCSVKHYTWIWRTSNDDNSDKIIARTAPPYGTRGHLKVYSRTPTLLPSSSSFTDAEGDSTDKDHIHNISNCEVTTPVTIKCINKNHDSKQGISVDFTKQTKISMFYSVTTSKQSNNSTQQMVDVKNTMVKDHTCKNSEAKTVMIPPINFNDSSCSSSSSSIGNQSRKRRDPLECITNESLAPAPKRKANTNHTKQVTLNDILTRKRK